MSLPTPRPGLVIRYAFLWSHEARAGQSEAAKVRPCAIVVAARRTPAGSIQTLVAPITHQPPDDPTASIEIPASVARTLGLDGERQWMRIDELNAFGWPGYDLRPLPGQPGRYDYGMLPQALFETLKTAILERHRRLVLRSLNRD